MGVLYYLNSITVNKITHNKCQLCIEAVLELRVVGFRNLSDYNYLHKNVKFNLCFYTMQASNQVST